MSMYVDMLRCVWNLFSSLKICVLPYFCDFHCFNWLCARVIRLHNVVVCLLVLKFYVSIDYLMFSSIIVYVFVVLWLRFYVVIDYHLVLLDYLLWFMACFGFVFYFNQLLYVLIDYKGLGAGGGGSIIFNWLHCILIDYLYQLLVFGWKQWSI